GDGGDGGGGALRRARAAGGRPRLGSVPRRPPRARPRRLGAPCRGLRRLRHGGRRQGCPRRRRTPAHEHALMMTKRMTRSVALARAQDLPLPGEGFEWERVGDRGLDLDDLAFGPDGMLWATANGPHRLDLTDGFPGRWIRLKDSGALNDAILPLGPDTLVGNT